jgi:pyruvate dehydrogenase E2 component (dihydrolipoamide acetyltransferase)
MDVVIPAIADGVQEVEILALLVRVGQHVLAEQPMLEVEAGKASFELPSPATGKIEEIRVGIGDDVKVGDVVLTLETVEDAAQRRSAPEPSHTPEPAHISRAPLSASRGTCVRASPAARRRARELGVDLDALAAELDGRVTIEQIEAHAGGMPARGDAGVAELDGLALRLDAETSVDDWRTVPHGTLHRTIDVTCLDAARRRYRDEHECGPRVTLTAFVLKACAIGLRQHPRMNSSLIRHGRALAIKRYVHVGVAVDNRRGLDLPVLLHVDQRPLCELADELESLTRADRTVAEQPESPTFSITNLRSFGGSGFTPLVHPPQVGALGMCRPRSEAGRTVLPVSLAYDRRVNDDAAASSFLATIAELLHDPMAMLMYA